MMESSLQMLVDQSIKTLDSILINENINEKIILQKIISKKYMIIKKLN